jgi:hypothetical protein
MMGLVCDIAWPAGTFDVSRISAFFVPRGTVYEVFPWCLHHTPIHVHEAEGFRYVLILPRGAHVPIDFTPEQEGEGKLMQGRNTWRIAYAGDSGPRGTSAHRGLKGRAIELRTLKAFFRHETCRDWRAFHPSQVIGSFMGGPGRKTWAR